MKLSSGQHSLELGPNYFWHMHSAKLNSYKMHGQLTGTGACRLYNSRVSTQANDHDYLYYKKATII